VKKQTRYYYCFFLLSTETSRRILCLFFFFFFPQFCGIKQTFGEVLKKLAKSVKFSVFFFKTFFFQKNKIQLSGKKYNFSFLGVPRPTKEKEKETLRI
jgi:hypothetical protein